MKKLILRLLLLALLGGTLGLCLYKVNAKLLLGDPLPMPLGVTVSRVLTGSMEPALSPNDLIVIRKTDTLSEGQIVVYQSGSSLTVHRILELGEDEVVTKGDANNAPDDPIPRELIKGEVWFSIPLLGAAVGFLQHPAVLTLLLLAAVLLFERSVREERRQKKQELEKLKDELDQLKKS